MFIFNAAGMVPHRAGAKQMSANKFEAGETITVQDPANFYFGRTATIKAPANRFGLLWVAIETDTASIEFALKPEHAGPRAIATRPGDYAAIYAEETGVDYATALVHCNMD